MPRLSSISAGRYGKKPVILLLAVITLLALATAAFANRVPTSSAGTAPITKTFPGALTMQFSRTGTAVVVNDDSAALNSIGAVTSAMLSPGIAATTEATTFDVSALGCVLSAGRCVNRGTITVLFNRPVTDPVLHFSGLGGNQGAAQSYHAAFLLSSFVASGTPTLTRTAGTTNFTVANGNEIRVTTVNGATSCAANPVAGCGSVRVNGTVTSLTFQVDMLTAGTGTPTAANVDTFTMTASVDEDFGDAPAAMETAGPAAHVVGGLYLGSSVTADNVAVTNGGTQASPNPSATASVDGGDDGVTFPVLERGSTVIVNVAVTGTGGLLQGWIDWGDDGSFATAGDRIATNAVDGGAGDNDGAANGVIALSVPVPAAAALTQTIARFRISSTSGLNFTGLAPDGEVEDYAVTPVIIQADLSLTKTVSNAAPTNGAAINYVLTVTNSATSTLTANGVTVTDVLPSGFVFTSATGFGTYVSGSGIWTVGSIPPGTSRVLTINGTVNASAGATVTNIAEVTASSAFDGDSTPNNAATGEDDYASRSFTVAGTRVAGTPPALICPAGQSTFDWDTKTWAAGSVNNSYTQPGVGLVNIALSANVTYQPRGSNTPFLDNAGFTGGLTPAQRALVYAVDFVDRQQVHTNQITFATTINGAQFTLFDIDYDVNQYSDRVVVTGLYQGNTVIPVLTNGVTNYVVGNSAVGDTIATNTANTGNVVVTFNSPVDSITITYGNDATLAPVDPTGQTMAVHDIVYCNPTAALTVTKISSVVSDPTNSTTNPKAIPGATMRYCILIANNGSGSATSVNITDPLPATSTYVPASLRSGTSCAGATTVEDDDAAGADESDPYGASRSGSTISATTATLANGASMAIAFQVTIN